MALRRRSRRTGNRRPDDDARDRSYDIWGFVALFTALALGGLFWLLFFASDDDSVQVPTSQTLPEGYDPTSTTTTTTTTTGDDDGLDVPAPTARDGEQPEGLVPGVPEGIPTPGSEPTDEPDGATG